MDDATQKLWSCKRCGKVLAEVGPGEPAPRMPPVLQVTRFSDRLVFVCECGYVQVWHRVAIDKDAHAV